MWQSGPLVGPYGSTPVVEGELVREDGQLVSETDEERAAIEAWSRLWIAMSVRRLARQREAIEEGRASPQSSMRSAPALDGGPLSVRTRFNQGLAKVRAAVEDEGLEAVRARFIYACRLQAGESPDLAPLSPVVMRQAEGRVAPQTPVAPLDKTGGAEAGYVVVVAVVPQLEKVLGAALDEQAGPAKAALQDPRVRELLAVIGAKLDVRAIALVPCCKEQHLEDAQVLQVLRLDLGRGALQLRLRDLQPRHPAAALEAGQLAAHRGVALSGGLPSSHAVQDAEGGEPLEPQSALDLGERRLPLVGALAVLNHAVRL